MKQVRRYYVMTNATVVEATRLLEEIGYEPRPLSLVESNSFIAGIDPTQMEDDLSHIREEMASKFAGVPEEEAQDMSMYRRRMAMTPEYVPDARAYIWLFPETQRYPTSQNLDQLLTQEAIRIQAFIRGKNKSAHAYRITEDEEGRDYPNFNIETIPDA